MLTKTSDLTGATWYQIDAAYLYREADKIRDRGGLADVWLATLIQNNAAHSARQARLLMGIET